MDRYVNSPAFNLAVAAEVNGVLMAIFFSLSVYGFCEGDRRRGIMHMFAGVTTLIICAYLMTYDPSHGLAMRLRIVFCACGVVVMCMLRFWAALQRQNKKLSDLEHRALAYGWASVSFAALAVAASTWGMVEFAGSFASGWLVILYLASIPVAALGGSVYLVRAMRENASPQNQG